MMDDEIVYDLHRLKPCPFCGSTVTVRITADKLVERGYNSITISPYHTYKPWCSKCGCTIDAMTDYNDMVERWNRRAGGAKDD